MYNKITDVKVIKDYIELCTLGDNNGWHERNGGNLTYRLSEADISELSPFFSEGEYVDIGINAPDLAGEYFISSGSGKYMKNVKKDPEDCICIIRIDESGSKYSVVWGLVNGGRPTSELPTHLLNHSVKKRTSCGKNRVIYHAHPEKIIALSFILPGEDKVFSRTLWQAMTECPIIFPQGIGVVKWMLPGGAEIAKATCEKMEKYDAVLWVQHGLFCAAESFDLVYGLMQTIEKAASIMMNVIISGKELQSSMSDNDLREAAGLFGLKINEDFLDN